MRVRASRRSCPAAGCRRRPRTRRPRRGCRRGPRCPPSAIADPVPVPIMPAPIPSYAPTEPPGLGFPPLPGDEPRSRRTSPRRRGSGPTARRPRRPVAAAARAVATTRSRAPTARPARAGCRCCCCLPSSWPAAPTSCWSQLLNNDDDSLSTAPPVNRPSASASAATPIRTLSPAELAASLQDAHFKHGYDWAKLHGAAPAADREQVCRTEALKQRSGGYPWGAHDRAGCLIGLAG